MSMTREERSRREAYFPRCACGSVARKGEAQCGRCRDRDNEKAVLIDGINGAESVDDLRPILITVVERLFP